MPDILLVEDKESLRRVLRLTLENAGYSVTEAADAREAVNEIGRTPHKVVLTDLRMPNGTGLDVLRAARAADGDVPVIVMTAYGSIDEAVQAMKDGAHDFLQKPVDSNHLLLLVGRALEQSRLRTENLLLREEWSKRYGFPRIIGESVAIKKAVAETQRVAQTEATVLLLGESGTGKELFARAVHHLSNRREQPLVAINCAAIPETLIENELFGRCVDRIGGRAPVPVDVRVVAATNKDLRKAVDQGEFRGDLFFRLAVFPIEIPPLRERGEDVVLLAHHFAAQLGKEMRGREATLSDASIAALHTRRWPGNVRELENAIERACILADSSTLEPRDLGLIAETDEAQLSGFDASGTLSEATDRMVQIVERRKIAEALAAHDGNKTRAAETLGVSYKTLLTKIKDYSL